MLRTGYRKLRFIPQKPPLSYSLSSLQSDDFSPRLLVVQPRFRPDSVLKTKLDESLNLAPHILVQNPAYRITRADTFFGPGTLDNIKCHLNAYDSKKTIVNVLQEVGIDAVFVNGILTGIQQRNLERSWGKPVLDRVGLIIEIFHAHAHTKEGKLQAELPALMYKRTRLVRVRGTAGRLTFGGPTEAEVVSARGRASGGSGFISGAGETELQLQRRRFLLFDPKYDYPIIFCARWKKYDFRIIERKTQLLSEIKEVRRIRALQRASCKRYAGSDGQHMPTIAIVGYTNAGKSSLVSVLSDTHLFCDNRMFATVDPKLQHVILPSGKKVLLSDTVGFISDLPVQLVEAFHATLEEVVEADLLVHVLDSSAPNRDEQRESVLQVLQQIGVPDEKLQNMIEVWNKIDLEDSKICVNEDNMDNDVDGWLSRDDEVEWDDDTASFVGWNTFEDEPKDVTTNLGAIKSDSKYQPRVKTSSITRVGLQELPHLIDNKLKTNKVAERGGVFDRKWRPPQQQDIGVVG